MRYLPQILLISLAILISGCLNPPMREPVKFYSLDLQPVEISHLLEVLPVQTDAPNKSEMIRRTDGVFIEMLDKHRWEQPPSRMLTRVLKTSLYHSDDHKTPAKRTFLNTTLLSFEHLMPENKVHLAVTYRIEDSARRSLMSWKKFSIKEPCNSVSHSDVARAMSSAVHKLTEEIAANCEKLMEMKAE